VEQHEPQELDQQIATAEQHLERRQLPDAIAAFHLAEVMGADPDRCSAARWTASMLRGDFEAAWCESDAIRRRAGSDPHRFWMGEDLRGKRVIVRCLHGFGDAIQFLRYVPWLQAMTKHVVVEVSPQMLTLAPLLDGLDDVVTWGEDAPSIAPEWDVQVEVMELPYLLRTTEVELPGAVRYLRVPRAEVREAERMMGSAQDFKVGVVWASGQWNPARSIPIEHVERMARSGCAEFWSLQGGSAREDGAALVNGGALRDAAVCGEGLRILAAVIANLDLVITVDTLAAHLAGAMGKPVWVMLQHAADWRWMVDRCDSPWYPRTRLFQQTTAGDWGSVIDKVQAELTTRIKSASLTLAAS